VLGLQLDLMILKVFSNLNDSVVLSEVNRAWSRKHMCSIFWMIGIA